MILVVYGIIVSLGLALATGGRLRQLGGIHLRGEWLLVTSLVSQLVLPALVPSGLLSDEHMVWLLWMLPGMLLFLALLANWRRFGLGLAAAGVLMNLVVVGANGGMPVSAAAAEHVSLPVERIDAHLESSWLHVADDADTSFMYFADVLPIPGPASFRGLASLGDIVLAVGVMHLIFVVTHEV